jgi:predicted nuclease of predicted toxin-antitoxin system
MRFLADECCDFAVVKALRSAGHDVLSVRDLCPGAEDAHVVEIALLEKRILLTEDKDFGQLVYAHGERTFCVIFLRYPAPARHEICRSVVGLVEERADSLQGCFVTVQVSRIRIGRAPRG